MKIALLEIETHYMDFYSLIQIFDTHENELYLFVSAIIHDKIKNILSEERYNRYHWVVKDIHDSIEEFFSSCLYIIKSKNIELLFLGTIQSNFNTFSKFIYDARVKTIATIHNVNRWFFPNHFDDSLLEFDEYRERRNILNQLDYLNVISENLKCYLIDNKLWDEPIFTLAFSMFQNNNYSFQDNNLIRFVISGSIEEKRRDYNLVIEVFEDLFSKYDNISLTLLGNCNATSYGRAIMKKCEELVDKGYLIDYFDHYVPELEYDEIMSNADIMIIPIHKKYEWNEYIYEIYGETKQSANILETVKYGKPCIIPKCIKVDPRIGKTCLIYENKEQLKGVIETLATNGETVKNLSQKAISNARKYSIEYMRTLFNRQYIKTLSHNLKDKKYWLQLPLKSIQFKIQFLRFLFNEKNQCSVLIVGTDNNAKIVYEYIQKANECFKSNFKIDGFISINRNNGVDFCGQKVFQLTDTSITLADKIIISSFREKVVSDLLESKGIEKEKIINAFPLETDDIPRAVLDCVSKSDTDRIAIFGTDYKAKRIFDFIIEANYQVGKSVDNLCFITDNPNGIIKEFCQKPVFNIKDVQFEMYDNIIISTAWAKLISDKIPTEKIVIGGIKSTHSIPEALEEYLLKNSNKDVVIFGAGEAGKSVYHLIQDLEINFGRNIHIKYFVDNDEKKWGTFWRDIEITSIEKIDINSIDKIIIASMWNKEILNQLLHLGVPQEKTLTV